MKKCAEQCVKDQVSCENKECRLWMDYEEDQNCCLIAVKKYGPMKLRQVAERIGISYVRVKHIQDASLIKLRKSCEKDELLCILPD